MQPKISVIITSYNQKFFLDEAILSVLNQTLSPFEMIIVDDCSTDGSQNLIQSYQERHPQKIRAFYNATNLGVSATKSFAQNQVAGEWVTCLDGDDRFLPQKLEKEWQYARSKRYKAVFSNFYKIDEDGKRLFCWLENEEPPQGSVFKEVFTRSYPRNTIFRNEFISSHCLKQIGYYDVNRITHEDWDFKIRLSKEFQVGYVPAVLSEYRLNAKGLSVKTSDHDRLQQMMEVYTANRILLTDLPVAAQNEIKFSLKNFFLDKNKTASLNTLKSGLPFQSLRSYIRFRRYITACFNS